MATTTVMLVGGDDALEEQLQRLGLDENGPVGWTPAWVALAETLLVRCAAAMAGRLREPAVDGARIDESATAMDDGGQSLVAVVAVEIVRAAAAEKTDVPAGTQMRQTLGALRKGLQVMSGGPRCTVAAVSRGAANVRVCVGPYQWEEEL